MIFLCSLIGVRNVFFGNVLIVIGFASIAIEIPKYCAKRMNQKENYPPATAIVRENPRDYDQSSRKYMKNSVMKNQTLICWIVESSEFFVFLVFLFE